MEENVALDSSKQKQFVKSIKGIKKLIKKNDNDGPANKTKDSKSKDGKISRPRGKPRGLVYLGHIPHGFYEHEMTQYFKQFGVVTNVRVIRSIRTGNSKGYAFVEFKDPAVAEIVAETMNNYLMGKRLIKAAYIPPEKQRRAQRKKWSSLYNPTSERRLKMKKEYNAPKSDSEDMKKARKMLSNFRKTKKKLSELGINYDFFTPVDIPEGLSINVEPEVKKEKLDIKSNNKNESGQKKVKKDKVNVEQVKDKSDNGKKEKVDIVNNQKEVKPKISLKMKENKTVHSKEQNMKEQKLKDAGVKHVGHYIKIKQDIDSDGDNDSSYEFDSDEFEKMLQNDSEVTDGEESDNAESDKEETEDEEVIEDEVTEDEQSVEEIVPLKKKSLQKVVQPVKSKKMLNTQHDPQIIKRKANQQPATTLPKKSKFENRSTQKITKKQFKKKK